MPAKVINLFAGPGAGKSTTAAGLFFLMKSENLKVELVTEFAKELTYNNDTDSLSNQLYVMGEQDRRQRRLVDKVDWIITDGPLVLNAVYASGVYDNDFVRETARWAFNSYDNVNFFVSRAKPYQPYGRGENESEARERDLDIRAVLHYWNLPYLTVAGDANAPRAIAQRLGIKV